MNAHLVIIGLDDIVSDKYFSCVKDAIKKGLIDGYSVIDLESQREEVSKKILQADQKPEYVYYLPVPGDGVWATPDEFAPLIKKIEQQKGKLKVYIATELKAHEAYLRFCIENNIDSLVEKPIFAPIHNDCFEPELIAPIMNELLRKAKSGHAQHSIMTLSRYHKIYNDQILDPLKDKVLNLNAPLTSYHFRHAGGVWNTHAEYNTREDHPYKYGYGMIMHGGYHYIDLSVQFLKLNKLLYPRDEFGMSITSYATYPKDQNDRISKKFSMLFDDDRPEWGEQNPHVYGETDIVSIFTLRNKNTGRTITLGTISLEQTTPSIRTWKVIPEDLYNKNGRISSVNFEAQLSTLFAVNAQCFDVPIRDHSDVNRIDAFARISTRANASLLTDEEYNTEETHSGLFHSDSNRKLMSEWLANSETRSRIEDHLQTMLMTQYLAISIIQPGHQVSFDFM